MEKRFAATLSRSQAGARGRSSSAIRPELTRTRTARDPRANGLGTADEAEAGVLKEQLNQLLADEAFWNASAKSEAAKRFNGRVVEIFFHGMEPEARDFGAIRDAIIPLPTSQESEYRRALLLGTTGAGKTTLLRQLIGTDPVSERFPSTSTAKTTVHETEVLLAPGPFKAVVTFFPIDDVREHLNECISEPSLLRIAVMTNRMCSVSC